MTGSDVTPLILGLTGRSHEISKPRDPDSGFSNRSLIWQAHRQQRCRGACQIAEYDYYDIQSRCFETSRDSYRSVNRCHGSEVYLITVILNKRHDGWNLRQLYCLFNHVFWLTSEKTSNSHYWSFWGKSIGNRWFPHTEGGSNAENGPLCFYVHCSKQLHRNHHACMSMFMFEMSLCMLFFLISVDVETFWVFGWRF